MDNITFEKSGDGIAVATIDMPRRAFNVFSDEMIDELETLIANIEKDETMRGVVIASGKAAFMAGADLAMVRGFTSMRFSCDQAAIRKRVSRLSYLLRRLEKLSVVTVAAVNGLALGGGLELAMACHYRVAVDSDKPCLGLPEVLLGLLPGAGGTQRLPRLVGPELAARMLLDGKPISPTRAHQAGLVDEVVANDDLLTVAKLIASKEKAGARWDRAGWREPSDEGSLLGAASGTNNLEALAWMPVAIQHRYPAIDAICKCLRDGYTKTIDEAIDVEIDNFTPLMLDAVAGNMVRTLFLSKTSASKRATGVFGKVENNPSIALRGELQISPRLLKRLGTLVEPSDADLIITSAEDIQSHVLDNMIVLRNLESQPETDCAIELRTLGELGDNEIVELAAEPSGLAAKVTSVVGQLGLIPIAISRSGSGPSMRFLGVIRHWVSQRDLSADDLGAIANLFDMRTLFERSGFQVGDGTEFNEEYRAAGLQLMVELSEEAASCLQDGSVKNAEDIDVLAVVGLGYPAWSGGPLSFADAIKRGEIEPRPRVQNDGMPIFYSD